MIYLFVARSLVAARVRAAVRVLAAAPTLSGVRARVVVSPTRAAAPVLSLALSLVLALVLEAVTKSKYFFSCYLFFYIKRFGA